MNAKMLTAIRVNIDEFTSQLYRLDGLSSFCKNVGLSKASEKEEAETAFSSCLRGKLLEVNNSIINSVQDEVEKKEVSTCVDQIIDAVVDEILKQDLLSCYLGGKL